MSVVETLPEFHGQGLFDRPGHLRDNLLDKLRVFHQSRSLSVTHDFRHRTAHIDVQNVEGLVLNLRGNLRHQIRLGAEKL